MKRFTYFIIKSVLLLGSVLFMIQIYGQGKGFNDAKSVLGTNYLVPDGQHESGATRDACSYILDDGSQETSFGLTAGGDIMWLDYLTATAGCEVINNISVAWGDMSNGGTCRIILYEDPNDDGNPGDAVYLAEAGTVVANANTNNFTNVSITPTLVSGGFFVAALYQYQPAGEFPAAFDMNSAQMNSWLIAQGTSGAFDVHNLMNNNIGPFMINDFGSGNFLLRAEGSSVPQGCNVLLLNADLDNVSGSPIQSSLLAYGDLGAVDLYDASSATPTLAQLQAYDVVVTWSNLGYANPTGIGDVLADYVDGGGKVINLWASIGTSTWSMGGRFMTGNYTAMNGSDLYYATFCLGSYNPGHPIMAGITNVCDFYRTAGTYLTPGSTAIANWSDGLLFVAVKNNKTVVSINGYVGFYHQWTGQMPDVLHNAIKWLCKPANVPVSNWALIIGMGLILLFAVVRFRKMV